MFPPDEAVRDLKETTALLRRQYERERRARQQAEAVLEANSLDLYQKHHELLRLNARLEDRVHERTAELARAVARAEQASAAKGAFLARMSHEIRTPMNGVLGMLEALLNTAPTETQLDYLRTAYASADMLMRLINDILDYSKIEAGKLDIESIPFDLRELLDRLQQSWLRRATDKGVELRIEIAPTVPAWLLGDPTRLQQVLINLVTNAIKFTPQGSVELTVTGVQADSGWLLEFVVSDTGVGIPAAALGHLFQPFSQADGSTSRRFGGTGLGLAICKQLVELMGGSGISIASEPDRGSRFAFALPFVACQAPDTEPALGAVSPTTPIANCRVLVVDDNETNRKVAGVMLERFGAHCRFATDGMEALQELQRYECDLVLMDCHMPLFDGFEGTEEIRRWERAAGRARIPIIAVSASAFAEDRQRCTAAGMDDFLPKPLTGSALADKLSRWLPARSLLPPAPSPSAAINLPAEQFDCVQLAEMRGVAAAQFDDFIRQFAANTAAAMPILRHAIDGGDAAQLRSVAHKLKGTAATLGARQVAALAFELEQRGRSAELHDASALLTQLETARHEACTLLNTLLGSAVEPGEQIA